MSSGGHLQQVKRCWRQQAVPLSCRWLQRPRLAYCWFVHRVRGDEQVGQGRQLRGQGAIGGIMLLLLVPAHTSPCAGAMLQQRLSTPSQQHPTGILLVLESRSAVRKGGNTVLAGTTSSSAVLPL